MKQAVFLDASVIVAALGSETGGSHRIIQYCHEQKLVGFANHKVLYETYKRSVKVNSTPKIAAEFIAWSKLVILPNPTSDQTQPFSQIVPDPDDLHLFGSTSRIPNCILISLDKKHVLKFKNVIRHPKIMSPGEFLQSLLNLL